jgi:hypothetical protein
MRYLKQTRDYVLRYTLDSPAVVIGFSDSDFAPKGPVGDKARSTSGFVFTFCGGAISWRSKRQTQTAQSTCEAELVALGSAAKEAMWLRGLCKELGLECPLPTSVFCDNDAATKITSNKIQSEATKHLDVTNFAVRDYVANKHLAVVRVDTKDNVADAFTKPLGRIKLQQFRTAMGVVRPSLA